MTQWESHHSEKAITNILSLNNAKKKWRITCDSDDDDEFAVHKSDTEKIEFKCAFDKLHHIDTCDKKKDEVCVIDTVKENCEGYSKR